MPRPKGLRDNVQIQAEGGSHSSYRGVACGAGGFLPHVCLSGLLRKPQKHSARGRLQIWLSATCRGPQYQARAVPSSFPSHPYSPGAARRHSTQSSEGTGQTPRTWSSGVVSTGWRGRCGVKEGGASAWTLPRAALHSVSQVHWLWSLSVQGVIWSQLLVYVCRCILGRP